MLKGWETSRQGEASEDCEKRREAMREALFTMRSGLPARAMQPRARE